MNKNKNNVIIDLSRDDILSDMSKALLMDRYKAEGETSPQHIFARAASEIGRAHV